MIYYNSNTINDWNFGDDNIIKVYRNNAIVFYKFDTETQEFKVCYAVVDDITQYSETEFEDVYDKATEKWYKLNNLSQYEEYGVYGEGRNITYYEGKLTIDDGYEYEWNGLGWINVGEVSGSTIPDNYVIPFEDSNVKAICVNNWGGNVVAGELTYGEAKQVTDIGTVFANNTNITSFNELAYFHGLTTLNQGHFAGCSNLKDIVIPSNVTSLGRLQSSGSNIIFRGCGNLSGFTMLSGDSSLYFAINAENGSYYMNSSHSSTPMVFPDRPMEMKSDAFAYYDYCNKAYFQSATPPTNLANSDISNYNKLQYVYCPVGSLSAYQTALAGKNKTIQEYDFETDSLGLLDKQKEWTHKTSSIVVYPKYYSEKSEPLNDLTFNTLAEAQAYAQNNCVYDGMHATIDGDRYYFDSSDENGWVKILEYYKVEDVTPNQASGWTISGSDTYNPDSSYYDDFDLETTSTSYSYKIAKVTIYGYDHFTYYLRTTGRTYYCYVVATNVDEIQTPPSSMSYTSSSAITNTYYWNKSPKSAVNLSNYRRVTYNNLDKTVEHTFYVYFYGRTYSSYVGNATILIPKEQTNENWEQVTFSASSNVASTNKSLYIDGNNSTNGGTSYWYHRWMIGLQSGSHSSYTNYSNYDYCPNVTSSTFTSVAGEQRQVNFTYDNALYKTLSFRLTDGSNVLTPSDTVYFNMTYYNSCGVSSSSSNVTFPRSQSVKVGGSFSFSNSSNRHYIYGYQPPTLGTRYYVDNYQSTFDITYTKLSDEAVTITYTTYDPSDTETPAFKTDITWPYNGGTTSSTTLTSYAVPYTYGYEVSQTSDKFSADDQSYTANQTARTINFVLYPNNREFATVADMEAYQYAWEGMKATVGDTKYQYKNGEWVENKHSLPDVPFTVNYNAKQYNASTKTLLKTEGQLANVDAVITAGTPTVHDGYLTIASGTRATIEGYSTYFNRTNSTPNLTIVSKQRTDGNNCHMFANRDSDYNWMYRCYSTKLTLHGSSEQGSVSVSTQPVIESVRINSSRLATYNNYTNSTSSTSSNFNYGGTNSGKFAIFQGYGTSTGEYFVGDFYWVYMCQGTLTDEQVQQVIDYNENL